jgi:transposase-like protein
MISLQNLLDNEQCDEALRQARWPEGVRGPHGDAATVTRQGRDKTQPARQKYRCQGCGRSFDDRTGTVFAGHHQPLSVWILCLYFMGLNLSNAQIARELGLDPSDTQRMAEPLRQGVVARQPEPVLSGEVECDEVYVVAGHKGHPEAVSRAGRRGRRRRLKGARGRGTRATEKPPIFGMIQRGGAVVIRMVENVQQTTIRPLIQRFIEPGSRVHTDEYSIYNPLTDWGYDHHTVCHSRGEYARDEDGDGFHEIHVNTQEGCWSLLRSGLRPHRGISQEKLPWYLGFFQFVHNVRRRGKSLLSPLLTLLVA